MPKQRPLIHTSIHGRVDPKLVEHAKGAVAECYTRIGAPDAELVEMLIFEGEACLRGFSAEEKRRRRVATGMDECFLTTHEAWTGVPRIWMCAEKLSQVPRDVFMASLHHEAAHTILHGSLEFYTVSIPHHLMDACRKSGVGEEAALSIVYLASVAVKDSEVTKLLCEAGFTEEQAGFATRFLEPSDEERVARVMARISPAAAALFHASLLKPIGCAAPLTADKVWGKAVGDKISRYVEALAPQQHLVYERFTSLFANPSGDFHRDLTATLETLSEHLQAWTRVDAD